jgi:glycoside/pentoside/hexuronide:cation symporter, GPH family
MEQDEKRKRLPVWLKFSYGAAEGSNTLGWTMFYVYFLFFLTDVVGLSPSFAGVIMMIATLWDAVTDPAVGIWSDRTKSRLGRRRSFMLFMSVPYGITLWLVFTDWGLSPLMTNLYFIGAVLLFFFAFTCLNIPYTSLAAEMTQDYDERTSLISYRAGWSQVFSIAAAGLPLVLVTYFSDRFGTGIGKNDPVGWSVTTGIFAVFMVFPILWTWRATRGYELFPEETKISFKDIVQGAFKNRPFRYIVGICALSGMALNVAAAVMVYFMTYYMKMTEPQQSLAFTFLFACTILWIPLVNLVSAKLEKRWAFIIFIGFWMFVQGIGGILVKPGQMVFFYVLAALASGGVIAVTMINWMMIPDAVEVDEFKTGHRREGLYFGLTSFVGKTASAIGLLLTGYILEWVGYMAPDPEAATKILDQTPNTILGIRLIWAEVTAGILVFSIVLAFLLPMTRQKHYALREAIRLKKEGRPYDVAIFKDII